MHKVIRVQYVLEDVWNNITDYNAHTTIIGLVSALMIITLRKVNKKIPNALVVVVLGILVIRYFGTALNDVDIVKDIPSGLPEFSIPELDIDLIRELLPIAFTLVMVGYLKPFLSENLWKKQDKYRIRPNQELIALGLSNMVGSLFKAYPSASSFQDLQSIKRQVGLLECRPNFCGYCNDDITFPNTTILSSSKTVLAAIIIVAVFGLVNIKEALFLWKASRMDFWLLAATFFLRYFWELNMEL